jgi:uncharacterized protein (DUF2267 family)
VSDRGGYASHAEAAHVTGIILRGWVSGWPAAKPKTWHRSYPPTYNHRCCTPRRHPATSSGIHESLRRLAGDLNAAEETARWDASAVLTTLAEAITGGQLNQILSQLPAEFAVLFGNPELA